MQRGRAPWAAFATATRRTAKANGHKLARTKSLSISPEDHYAACVNPGCHASAWFNEDEEAWGTALTNQCPLPRATQKTC